MISPGQTLSIEDVVCEFPGVRALDGVSLVIHPGRVHAITGENGAGKSTLIKVIGGILTPTVGSVRFAGETFKGIRDAWRLGVRTIPQEPSLAQDLSLAENIYLGRLPCNRFGVVDWDTAFAAGQRLLEQVGLAHLGPRQIARSLTLGEQQLIQTARALTGGGRIFLFDEPTSSLNTVEADRLATIIRNLASSGAIVIYVSHRIREIFAICDTVSVLRDGRLVGSRFIDETNPDQLIGMMVGRAIPPKLPRALPSALEPRLRIDDLRYAPGRPPVSFQASAGEILGLAGLAGAGSSEILESIFGSEPSASGQIQANGHSARIRSPRDATRHGIALVPGDRKRDGLVLQLDIVSNLALPNARLLSRFGFVIQRRARRLCESLITRLSVKCTGPRQRTATLSGGNQQKVVIGKWIATDPSVLLLDEPTRGVDVGAKAEIHDVVRELAAKGIAVVLASSEMPELIELCDRVLVLCEGRLTGELQGSEITEEAILALAAPGMEHLFGSGHVH